MVVNHPVFSLFALWHWTTVKLYHIKWFGKIYFISLHSTRPTVIPYYTNPFFKIVQVYASRA